MMTCRLHRVGLISLVLIVACILGGCTTEMFRKFSRPNYETLYPGQEDFEVRKTLGRPTIEEPGQWTYINERPYYKAIIFFDDEGQLDDKVWYASRDEEPNTDVGDVPGHDTPD